MRLSRRLAAAVAHPLLPYAWALLIQAVFAGYVKDDAYIEYRYATHLAQGYGLTFNVGDRPVEGFTSFLWTVALALPAKLHLPLLVLCKLAGAAALCGTIATVARLARRRAAADGGDAATQARAAQVGRLLAATNASLLVWAQSGMEPVVAAFVVVLAVERLTQRRHRAALLLFAVAAGLRPECHLLLGGAALLVTARRDPVPALGALALVGLMHLFRWRYFGALLPNTALVKLGALDLHLGLRMLGELAVTSLGGLTLALALVEAARTRDDVALLCAGALALFCAYLLRIGRDEMFLVRLFLPVWPLALALAAPPLARARTRLGAGVRAFATLVVCGFGIGFTAGRLHTIGYWALGERSHVVLADLMRAHARPGELVVFQDLGQTPWAAMDLRFVDPIGLVDPTIARIRFAEHASPFMRAPSPAGQAAIRDHLFALDPKLVAFVAYVPSDGAAALRREADAARTPADRERLFAFYAEINPYYCGLYADPRFRRYRYVDVIRRKDNYWFVLYERA